MLCRYRHNIHLIRASLRYASRRYRVPLTRDLRPIYTAADETAAAAALEDFAAARGERYPAIVKVWRAHWAEFSAFLAFPPEVRRVIYTTDENVNLLRVLGLRAGVPGRSCRMNRGPRPRSRWSAPKGRTTLAGMRAAVASGLVAGAADRRAKSRTRDWESCRAA